MSNQQQQPNNGRTNQCVERLDSDLQEDVSHPPTYVPKLSRDTVIPKDTSAKELQESMVGIDSEFLYIPDATYLSIFYAAFTGVAENFVIPTSLIMGSVTVYLVREVWKQARKAPHQAITSKSLLRGHHPQRLSLHVISSAGLFLWNKQYLSKTGGLTAWNRYDLFFFTMAFNVIATLIIKVFLWYHNKHVVKKHCD